jgi:Mn2+/Fe2+ NRAMP family transporter
MIKSFFHFLRSLGPGIVVAATGVGAGDLVSASVAGAKYGVVILWAAVFGAAIKFALNEGIARWQLATGTTLISGWRTKLPGFVSIYFIVYLVPWSFIVAGALISACGLAAHALVQQISVPIWGVAHSIIAFMLIYFGRYDFFENIMKFLIALMFAVVLICAMLVGPEIFTVVKSMLWPSVPAGSGKFLLGVIGGVGGSVTLLSYGYWIREKGWNGTAHQSRAQIDLGAAYLLTGMFGVAVMIIAADVNPTLVTGNKMVLEVAERLSEIVGPLGKWCFLIGFWGAVFSSMLGVWQGVPYLFTDFVLSYRRRDVTSMPREIGMHSIYYRFYLFYLSFPPMLLLLFSRPVWIVIIYTIAGAFFMPFLAAVLLVMNNRKEWVGELRNTWIINIMLGVALVLFGYLCATEILEM